MKFVAYYRLSKKKKDAEQYVGYRLKRTVCYPAISSTQAGQSFIGSFEEHETGTNNNSPQA